MRGVYCVYIKKEGVQNMSYRNLKRRPFMPGYLAIVAFKDFDCRFSSAFTSTGMTCIPA